MKLISEHVDEVEYITEADAEGKKNYKIRGVFMQSEIKNRNGRMYPQHVLEKEVKRYNKEYVKQRRAFGELGHPDGPTVNLERVSHMITKLTPDGKNFIGEAKVMDTPYGKIVSQPSAPNAFVEGIMEGKEWVWENGVVKEVDIATYKQLLIQKRKYNEDKNIQIFKDFMSKL